MPQATINHITHEPQTHTHRLSVSVRLIIWAFATQPTAPTPRHHLSFMSQFTNLILSLSHTHSTEHTLTSSIFIVRSKLHLARYYIISSLNLCCLCSWKLYRKPSSLTIVAYSICILRVCVIVWLMVENPVGQKADSTRKRHLSQRRCEHNIWIIIWENWSEERHISQSPRNFSAKCVMSSSCALCTMITNACKEPMSHELLCLCIGLCSWYVVRICGGHWTAKNQQSHNDEQCSCMKWRYRHILADGYVRSIKMFRKFSNTTHT